MNQFSFVPATKEKLKLRLALTGVAGSGKTWTALAVATRIAERQGGQVAVIDTEHGRARLYSDRFTFQHLDFPPPFSPERYGQAIAAAEAGGFGVVIIDSLSHAWMGEGGVLQIVDDEAARNRGGTFGAGWRKGTPAQNSLIEAILQCRIHVIATMRSKQEYAVEEGGKSVKKLGMAPVQREGVDYEFDIVGDLTADHKMAISKSRCDPLADKLFQKPGVAFADAIIDWLDAGAEPSPKAMPFSAASSPDTPDRTPPSLPASNGAGQAFREGDDEAARRRFWGTATELGYPNKRAVHDAFGVEARDGALAEWKESEGLSWATLTDQLERHGRRAAVPA